MLAVYHVVIILCLLYMFLVFDFFFFFFKQKTAYEMRISDWSSDVCSSDLRVRRLLFRSLRSQSALTHQLSRQPSRLQGRPIGDTRFVAFRLSHRWHRSGRPKGDAERRRSEEHTSELQSLMRISYAVFCLKKKKSTNQVTKHEKNKPNSIKQQ